MSILHERTLSHLHTPTRSGPIQIYRLFAAHPLLHFSANATTNKKMLLSDEYSFRVPRSKKEMLGKRASSGMESKAAEETIKGRIGSICQKRQVWHKVI
jgi:hypothetical protein